MRVILRLTLSLHLVAVAAAGCDNSVMETEPAPLGEVIASWVPLPLPTGVNRANEAFYISAPARARNAFASASFGAPTGCQLFCSGVMIGPNLLMSAAHCTPPDTTFGNVRVYNPNASDHTFPCYRLMSTDNDTDLVLLYCPTEAGKVAPGLRFGYADLGWWMPSGSDQLYSIWRNNVGGSGECSATERDVMLWSQGQPVGFTDPNTAYGNASTVVGQPLCVGSPPVWNSANQVATEMITTVAVAGGGSGSPQFDGAQNLLVVGPTTAGGLSNRMGLPWNSYMTLGWLPNAVNDTSPADGVIDGKECFNSPFPSTFDSVFSSLGLSAATFRGQLLDGNGDFVIDAQRAIEQSLGEPYRDYMFPWFGSLRNNVQWTLSSGTNINPGTQLMTIPANGTARWRGPKSGASGTYMVSIDAQVSGGNGSEGPRSAGAGAARPAEHGL